MRGFGFLLAASVGVASAFVPTTTVPTALTTTARQASVSDLLVQTEQSKILSQASRLGLLSKLEAAGLTLKDVEGLLPLLDELDAIGTGKELAPQILSAAPALLKAAPGLLPIAASVLSIPPPALLLTALASLGGAGALIAAIPDDSLTSVALQAFLAIPLLTIVPGAALAGAAVLGRK